MPLTHKTDLRFATTLTTSFKRNLWHKDTVRGNMLEKMLFIVVLRNVSIVVLVQNTIRLCGLRSEVEKDGKSVGTCQTGPLIFGGA